MSNLKDKIGLKKTEKLIAKIDKYLIMCKNYEEDLNFCISEIGLKKQWISEHMRDDKKLENYKSVKYSAEILLGAIKTHCIGLKKHRETFVTVCDTIANSIAKNSEIGNDYLFALSAKSNYELLNEHFEDIDRRKVSIEQITKEIKKDKFVIEQHIAKYDKPL